VFDEQTAEVDHDAGGQHHRRDVEKPPPEASSSSSRHDPTAQSPWRIKKISIAITSSDQGWTTTPIPADGEQYLFFHSVSRFYSLTSDFVPSSRRIRSILHLVRVRGRSRGWDVHCLSRGNPT
jgi:hypothetical protein